MKLILSSNFLSLHRNIGELPINKIREQASPPGPDADECEFIASE